LATSPLLFSIYFDNFFRKIGLLRFKLHAYPDDFFFNIKSQAEIAHILNQLESA
jgi:hypothetical protein